MMQKSKISGPHNYDPMRCCACEEIEQEYFDPQVPGNAQTNPFRRAGIRPSQLQHGEPPIPPRDVESLSLTGRPTDTGRLINGA